MRVTDAMRARFIGNTLNRVASDLHRYQVEVASGLRIQRPSDDPAGALRASSLRSGLMKIEQYKAASSDAVMWLTTEDQALSTVQDAMRQVRSFALEGSNPMMPEARDILVRKMHAAAGTLVQAANANDGTRFLFGGHKTREAPLQGTPPGAVTYRGDAGTRRVAIGDGITLTLNHSGNMLLNIGGAANPALTDAFQTIRELADAVQNNDETLVNARLADLDAHLTRVTDMRAETGVKMEQARLALDQLGHSRLVLTDLLAETESADLSESLVRLKERENLLQAATYVASTIGRGGLMSWLR